jgi:membrane protease YdiL (CAAX protease family)
LWPWLAVPPAINSHLQSIGLTADSWPYFIAYFIIINPWLEEFFWRGFLVNLSRKIVLNDLLFAGYHLLVLAGTMDAVWLAAIFLIL